MHETTDEKKADGLSEKRQAMRTPKRKKSQQRGKRGNSWSDVEEREEDQRLPSASP